MKFWHAILYILKLILTSEKRRICDPFKIQNGNTDRRLADHKKPNFPYVVYVRVEIMFKNSTTGSTVQISTNEKNS